MKELADAIARKIRQHVLSSASSLVGLQAEFRSVFNGPPMEILELVFKEITRDGGIEAQLGSGEIVKIPVLLQFAKLDDGMTNPPIGASGKCDLNHLLDLRNSTSCPRFIGLVPPGRQANISQTSTRSDFGLEAHNNSSAASSKEWWSDEFIQSLVNEAISFAGIHDSDQEDARKLIHQSVAAAHELDINEPTRREAWTVLALLWRFAGVMALSPGERISLACGYPPTSSGKTRAEQQSKVLKELASRMENGFRAGIEHIQSHADEDERSALNSVLGQLLARCEVPTALSRSMPHYYRPPADEGGIPPRWWSLLTVEKWNSLLDDDDMPLGTIKLECINSIASQGLGLVPVVRDSVELRITVPDDVAPGTTITVVRNARSPATRREWKLVFDGVPLSIEDEAPPPHKTPLVYAAQAENLKNGSVKVVSLEAWVPGFIVSSRNAAKATVPRALHKKAGVSGYEATLILNGEGRHYLDVLVSPGLSIGKEAWPLTEIGKRDEAEAISVYVASDTEYGLEITALNDRVYELEINHPTEGKCVGRIVLACEEISPETCNSEFDRLIRLNRRETKQGAAEVHLSRQHRCSDLQSWLIDESKVEQSFFPIVLAPDYADDWRTRDWTSLKDTVFSSGVFVHDPRPAVQDMQPPAPFIELRRKIAQRIRGKDGDGLVESAKLGEWMSVDEEFAAEVEAYVRAYDNWLADDPDNAAWCDIAIVARFEADGTTLHQEPDAIIFSPLHPVRLGWHCLAQKILFLAQKHLPCPAASILDPDCVPDAVALPLRTPSGEVKRQVFLSLECSSDYWSVLWNGSGAKLGQITASAGKPPFDQEFGLLLGGISSGFSVAQVHRALSDLSDMLSAKPILNILISSAAGQNNACNEGVMSWCRGRFTVPERDEGGEPSVGRKMIQVLDERGATSRPEDAVISNLVEDTGNAVRWYSRSNPKMVPDLGIIAQLELSNLDLAEVKKASPMGLGGLVRSRLRDQWKVAKGVILAESRMGSPVITGADEFADKLSATIARLENLTPQRYGYQFAPSPHAIETVLTKADFAAVSSSTVDPACFLGGWLDRAYLWDYALPSYSSRSDDTNGYYLLSSIKDNKYELLAHVLKKLPGCDQLTKPELEATLLEISRRGIPTVRGMSGADTGASGDLGMFVAARVIQDEFRGAPGYGSLLPIHATDEKIQTVYLLVPVDPFKGYFEDLSKVLVKSAPKQRPDMLVLVITYTDSSVNCKLTPIEVKYRGTMELGNGAIEALGQAKALSGVLEALKAKASEPEMVMWKLAFQHLLISMINFAFRVYSQQAEVSKNPEAWNGLHQLLIEQIYSNKFNIEIDSRGRLIVVDSSKQSAYFDNDGDHFNETIVISHADAGTIVKTHASEIYQSIKSKIGAWDLCPRLGTELGGAAPAEEAAGLSPSTPAGQESPDGSLLLEAEEHLGPTLPAPAPVAGAHVEQDGGPHGVTLLIGETIDGFRSENRYLDLSNTSLNQMNIGVVGDLGTGKTQLLKSIVAQIARSTGDNHGVKPKVLIFDYKKDYSSPDFIKATGAKVVLPHQLPLNLFSLADANNSLNPVADRIRFFSDVLDKIYSGVGPVQRANLRAAIKRAYEACRAQGRDPTIYDVHENYHSTVGKPDSVTSIMDNMVDMELFSREPGQDATFDKFLDGVVVISLNALGQDDNSKNMIVAVMLNMFYERMLRIPKRPYFGTSPQRRIIDSFLLVDEADKIMKYNFEVLKTLLLEGREFGVGIILASQYLSHFKAGAMDYKEPLLTWCIHKVPNVTPQELATLGLMAKSTQVAERIKSLGLHECLYKTFDVQGDVIRGLPFYKLPHITK